MALYLIPTPIGNLGDLSRRVEEVLLDVDFLAVEDTRVTIKLLNHLNIKKSMVLYHRHNYIQQGDYILHRLLAGETCGLVTDAGTPAISDPGEDLVARCAQAGVEVVSLPGPCALVTALSVSGLPTTRFTFEGFLPMHKKNRKGHLAALEDETRTMVFYEAPHKLLATLEDFIQTFGGNRSMALCRELSKRHEEVRRSTIEEALLWYREHPPKGEFVLVVGGAPPKKPEGPTLEEGLKQMEERMEQGMSRKEAAKSLAQEFGFSRKELYDGSLAF